jgi:tetratricopeptide (TPR) repeat protein
MARLLTIADLNRVASMSGNEMQSEYTVEELGQLQQMHREQSATTKARSDSVQAVREEEARQRYPGIEGGTLQVGPWNSVPLSLMQRLGAGFASTEDGRKNILSKMGAEGRAPEPISRPGEPDIAGKGISDIYMGRKGPDFGEIDYYDLPGDIADEVGPSLAPIGGTVVGLAGLLAGGGPFTSLAGGTIGSSAGDAVRQGVSSLLGSEEPWNPQQNAREAMWGVVGEAGPIGIGGGKTLTAGIKKAWAPFRDKVTFRQQSNILKKPMQPKVNVSVLGPRELGTRTYEADLDPGVQQRISDLTGRQDPKRPFSSAQELDERLGTNLAGTADVASRTESPFLTHAEARMAGSAKYGDRYRYFVREPAREEQAKALREITEQAGIPLTAPSEGLSKLIKEAAEETLEARKNIVNDLFEASKVKIQKEFGDIPIAVEKENIRSAFADIKMKIGWEEGQYYKITKKTQNKLADLEMDLSNIQNYNSLDAFRKALGNLLDSKEALGEFEKVGLDRHFKNLYGAIANDLDEALKIAAAARGEIMPGISGGSLIRSRNIGDAEQVIGFQKKAKMDFQELLKLDDISAQNILNDTERLDLVVDALTGPTVTADMVKGFKQKIGAEGTESYGRGRGFPPTEKGTEAWRNFQREVLEQLRAESILDSDILVEIPIDGKKLLAAMDRLGSDAVLKEIFPVETVDLLRGLGKYIRDQTKSQRVGPFNFPDEMQNINMNDWFSAVKSFVTKRTDRLLSPGLVGSETYKRYLTSGLGQGPIPQGVMSLFGRGVPQFGYREIGQGNLGDLHGNIARGLNQTFIQPINPWADPPTPGQ